MKFEWENLCTIGDMGTSRAKVIGGWIVRSVAWSKRDHDWTFHLSESSVFVPDPNHEWTIEE